MQFHMHCMRESESKPASFMNPAHFRGRTCRTILDVDSPGLCIMCSSESDALMYFEKTYDKYEPFFLCNTATLANHL